jgi:hypothetical protein
MTKGLSLEQTRIAGGVWEGVLRGADAAPPVEALHGGRALEGVEMAPVPGKAATFTVRVPIPGWALNEGAQSFLIQSEGATLAQFTVVAGQSADGDLRAELSLLRAELDLLKRAFQRHVREG